MQIKSLGHTVLKVRNIDRAGAFYNGVLDLPIATRNDKIAMTFLLSVTIMISQ